MTLSPAIDAACAGLLGLLVGSFLNVVVYRLPVTMYRQWLGEAVGNLMPNADGPTLWETVFGSGKSAPMALEQAAAAAAPSIEVLPELTLSRPRSRCGSCGRAIAWYENIPVLSYLVLRGRCSACQTSISMRYPLVELFTAAMFAIAGARFGLTPQAALWAGFCALLICQFLIDLDTQLLPDPLNYALLWLGLVGAALGWTGISLSMAVWGAIGGYLSLWLVYHAYRLITGKEGMGYGDFKLLAALGGWLGAHYLIGIILAASLVGAVVGGGLLLAKRLAHKDVPISFGPFLAGAGLLCFAVGPERIQSVVPFAFPIIPH